MRHQTNGGLVCPFEARKRSSWKRTQGTNGKFQVHLDLKQLGVGGVQCQELLNLGQLLGGNCRREIGVKIQSQNSAAEVI